MIIDENIHNKLREQYNPDGSDLRTLQLHLLDILIEFDRICRKNNIDYWLDGGTLIGAARHDGFLPWDDDIDVCILRKDLKRLKKALKKDLPKLIFLGTVPTIIKKIYNRNVTVSREVPAPGKTGKTFIKKENIWMDVFLIVNGTPSVSKFITKFYGPCYRRRYKIIEDGKARHILGTCLYPFTLLVVMIARLLGKVFHKNSLIYDYGSGYYAERRANEIFPLSEIEFEGYLFKAPNKTEDYLTRIHGDWKTLPEHIFTHNIKKISIEKYDKQK